MNWLKGDKLGYTFKEADVFFELEPDTLEPSFNDWLDEQLYFALDGRCTSLIAVYLEEGMF